MTKTVEVKITACAEGVTTVVKIDGELVSNRTIVPTQDLLRDGCIDLKPGDLITDLDEIEYPDLAEILDDRLSFLDMELLKWFQEEGDE